MQYLHGTQRAEWHPHVGACLTDDESAALASAAIHGSKPVALYAVDIELAGLVVADLSDEVDRDNQHWPGDTARDMARLQAEGYDVVTYSDETESGREMLCVRLVSDRAVAACSYFECEVEA